MDNQDPTKKPNSSSYLNRSMQKREIGKILIIGSLILWLIDRFSLIISTFLGKMYCGDQYMQSIDGSVGDVSCGFNTDIYLAVCLLIVLIIGITLIITVKFIK
ncbi:hypothetical protein KKF55_01810 [Patescibacteria group bacterium]|nr:hypothetical protein [Patescibacteria group bacterium]